VLGWLIFLAGTIVLGAWLCRNPMSLGLYGVAQGYAAHFSEIDLAIYL